MPKRHSDIDWPHHRIIVSSIEIECNIEEQECSIVNFYVVQRKNIKNTSNTMQYLIYLVFSTVKKSIVDYWTDQVDEEGGAIVRRTWARQIHSSTGVPPHVCTQQGRVNAQQGRCPLNLEGFLNANANRSFSIRASTSRDDRSTIRRVIARARNKRTRRSIRDRVGRAKIPRLASRTMLKDSRTRTPIPLSRHHGHRDRTGISSFSSELRVFLLPFFLSFFRTHGIRLQTARRDRLGRLFPELRVSLSLTLAKRCYRYINASRLYLGRDG